MEKRFIQLVIKETCEECPYCLYNGGYTMVRDSGYNCEHSDSPINRIVDDWEIGNSNNKNPKGWPSIPEKCPLPRSRDEKFFTEPMKRSIEKYSPIVTNVINEFDPIGVFPEAPESHYSLEIQDICLQMGQLHGGPNFISISQIIYVIMAHYFGIQQISEKDCLVPAKKIATAILESKQEKATQND